jgi:beta-glucosidase
VEAASRITAIEVRATGINWSFAPCVTVPQDIRWGRTYEGFSESPDIVRELGLAAMNGLQHGGLANPQSVLACSKHFAGDGGTTFGTGMPTGPGAERYPLDRGDTRGNEAALRKIHMPGYTSTVPGGVGSIMPSYSSWNGEKASGSKHLLTDILKNEMGFEGFLISDYNATDELARELTTAGPASINAGMDMVMVPERYAQFFKTMQELAAGGIPMSRIDDAVMRILRVKFAMGLMDPKRNHLADRTLHKVFGSSAAPFGGSRLCAAVGGVLKNDRRALPLSQTAARIHVAGKSAEDIGNMCGGWTIKWQGESGNVTSGGTTILAALRKCGGRE